MGAGEEFTSPPPLLAPSTAAPSSMAFVARVPFESLPHVLCRRCRRGGSGTAGIAAASAAASVSSRARRSSECTPHAAGLDRLRRLPPQRPHASAVSLSPSPSAKRKTVVFLGSPAFAATTLLTLHRASKKPDSTFDVGLVVTQPPQTAGRKRQLTPTPVHMMAEELSLPVVAPIKASDEHFLAQMRGVAPQLCVTAAYGNFLPRAFLDVPAYGTVNIHPSLLPQLRGAAPVPRALEAGHAEVGVSLMYTVLKMDAGPVIAQTRRALRGDEKASELLDELFADGAQLLLQNLPALLDGTAHSVPQDEDDCTHAPKLDKLEGRIAFNENALYVHNKVRAFAEWPGAWGEFELQDERGGVTELRMRLVTTRVVSAESVAALGVHDVDVASSRDALRVTCDDGSVIDLVEVQPASRKVMSAASYKTSLKGKTIRRKRVPH